MTKFDYMEFEYDGSGFYGLVFNAKMYTKEQAVEIFNKRYNSDGYYKCDVNDIKSRCVKYYPKCSKSYHSKKTAKGGCYAIATQADKGIFSVWVIVLDELEINYIK